MEENMTTAELVAAASEIGQQMLESGAEIYRVEESMYRLCVAYGAWDTHVYAVPTSIIVTTARPGETPITRTRRIYTRGVDLDRLDRLNALCRALCAAPQDAGAVRERLAAIEARPRYGVWTLRLAFGAIAAFFTLLFDGGIGGALTAFGIGLLLRWLLDAMERVEVNLLFTNIVGGALIGTLALAVARAGFAPEYRRVIVGSIMTLVPGLAITNSMRDLIAGDVIAGMAKFTEALLVAAGIAVGVALPLAAARWMGGL